MRPRSNWYGINIALVVPVCTQCQSDRRSGLDCLSGSGENSLASRSMDVRFGSKADMCSARANVRFTPESDIKCDIMESPLWANSRLMHRSKGSLFDHLIRARLHRWRHADAKGLGGFDIDDQFKLRCLHNWQFGGIFTLENSASINAGQAVAVKNVRSVAHQTASHRKV